MKVKTNGLVLLSITVIITGILIGGCKEKEGPKAPDESTPKKNDSSAQPGKTSTPLPVENSEGKKRIDSAATGNDQITKIARSAEGWSPALAEYKGKDAPDMNMRDMDGNSLSISGYEGKDLIIVRWSTRREESKQMVQNLIDLQNKIGKDKLAVIAISKDDPAALKQPEVKDMNIPFPLVARGGVRMKDPYRTIPENPVTFFIDKEGKIQLIARDVVPKDTLEKIVEAL